MTSETPDPKIVVTIHEPPTLTQQFAALQAALVEAHKRGEHPYGSMRRGCPLCHG